MTPGRQGTSGATAARDADRRATLGRPGLLRRGTPLPPWRLVAGWVLAVGGPPVLTVLLLGQRDLLGLPTDLMFFFTLVVGTALVGGLFPALVSALLGSSLLNYFFTEPTGGLTIDDPEQALAVVLFTLVAVAVASLVDVAERRSSQARAAQTEATALAELSQAVLGGADTPQRLVEVLARRFGTDSAVLLDRTGPGSAWRPVAWFPPHEGDGPAAPDLGEVVSVGHELGLALPGRATDPRERRVLEAFAAQTGLVLERERLREEARRAQELEAGTAVRTALLTAASHDLRTPLAAIRTAVDGLAGTSDDGVARPVADEDRAALVGAIDVSTGRLERLIDNLLDLSILHTGALRPEVRPTSLEEFVPAGVEGIGTGEVVLDVAESVPLVLTDPGLVERVVANLVQNACRFTSSTVVVSATTLAAAVEVHVIDTGPGVRPADRARVFEPFQRLSDVPGAPGAGGHRGLGLGLAVAHGLAEAVGASIEARDTPGGGLTMVLTLPRATPAPTPPDGEAPDGEAPDGEAPDGEAPDGEAVP